MGDGLLRFDTQNNPTLSRWNRVHLPYCSQDLWTGTVSAPTASTFGYYFSGHLLLEAVLDALDAQVSPRGALWGVAVLAPPREQS